MARMRNPGFDRFGIAPRRGGAAQRLEGQIASSVDKMRRALLEVHGRNLEKDIDFFTYRIRFDTFDNGETRTGTIPIQADSDFIWVQGVALCTEATTGIPFVMQKASTGANNTVAASPILSYPFRVKITDTGIDRNITDGSQQLNGLFGSDANLPYNLPRQRLFKRSSTILVEVNRFAEGQVDSAWAATNVNLTLELLFIGTKIFDERFLNLTSLS